MLQFETYPIFIVHSLHRQQKVEPMWQEFSNKRIAAREGMKDDLSSMNLSRLGRDLKTFGDNDRLIDAVFQWQIVDDLDVKYKKEIEAYQRTIYTTLTNISHTSIGKQLLTMLGAQKVYIVPQDSPGPARTLEATDEQGAGIRIFFSPDQFSKVFVGPGPSANAVEDTLFHELVHAMRLSTRRYFPRKIDSWDFNYNSEEFIAEQLANVYHASRGESDFYGSYNGSYLRKKAMYKYLEETPDLVRALKFYLSTEPLAIFTAHLYQPDYNPFRDFKEIDDKSYLRMFPDDDNPFRSP
jgi:hypothetical protein